MWLGIQRYMDRVSSERVPYSFAVKSGVEDRNYRNKNS